MKPRIILFLVLGIAALAATVHEVHVAAGGKLPFAKSGAVPPMASSAPVTKLVRAEGHLVTYPGASVTVGTEVQGTVVSLPVKEKDFVRKGQPIAVLRCDDNRAALASSEARVTQDDADIRLYQVERSGSGNCGSRTSARGRLSIAPSATWNQPKPAAPRMLRMSSD